MALSVGIVGLPNVGKSTLFNSLSSAKAEAANYPFCTIEPNVGVVSVPDERLAAIDAIVHSLKIVPTAVQFVDIAGLVKGASKGEGLGNQFLSHIREANAIAQVVRCFDDPNVVHVENKVDPVSDVETINVELCLKDMDTVGKRLDKARKAAKGMDAKEKIAADVCEKLFAHLEAAKPARTFPMPDNQDAHVIVRELQLLTGKPCFYVANVDEASLGKLESNKHWIAMKKRAEDEGAPIVPVCAALEEQIAALEPADRPAFLEAAGLKEPGLHAVIRAGYKILDLYTFFTAGKPEVRAWTVKNGARAPQAAGVIHTDFERGFIKAEITWWEDFVKLGGEAKCRDAGKLALVGKDYVMRDGDIAHFLFNV